LGYLRSYIALLAVLVCGQTVVGQQILVDRGIRAAELWCFPTATDTSRYMYVPSNAHLNTDEAGAPQFSFVRYASVTDADPSSAESIVESAGGAILTFLVTYTTPADQIEDAERELRRITRDADVTIAGPVMFTEGRYTLISSIVTGGQSAQNVALATGRAPVLEGNAVPLSFQLEPDQATLLLRSLETKTPDISLVYEMSFSGLADAYDADLTVDWSQVRESSDFKAGGSIYFVGADVEVLVDKLRRDNTVRLEARGSSANMEALVDRVYDKIVRLLFDPVEPARVTGENKAGLMEALNFITKPENLTQAVREITGFGFNASYKRKSITREGTSVFSFRQQESVERYTTIVFNVGDLYKRYGDDPAYFRDVNLFDPVYQQRIIHVGLDGALLPEFDRFVNSVTLTIRKSHDNGVEEVKELVLGRDRVREGIGDLQLVYGWNGDDDRGRWLEYEYRTSWSFQNGGKYETDWQVTETPMIDLFAPYVRRTVEVLGEPSVLVDRGVRAVVVRVSYPFFGDTRSERRILYASGDGMDSPIELTQPLGEEGYTVSLLWQISGGGQVTRRFDDDSGLIVVDEVPDS